MDDILARIFVIFLVFFYASIALVFVGAGIRTWVWQPLRKKFHSEHSAHAHHFHRMHQSTHSEGSPS